MKLYKPLFKPFFDFSISLVLLIILSPIILLISLILVILNKGHVFFIQNRPGMNEKIFRIIKFQTMVDKRDNNGILLPDNDRLTLFGSFLRKTSLDELPQFINVVKGDLSLIGPRPLLVEYLPLYNSKQRRRHDVKPGISGWAQVNGRNALSWEEKFEYDVWYVDNICFSLDAKILLLTILKVFKTKNINSSETTTMPKFTGTKLICM